MNNSVPDPLEAARAELDAARATRFAANDRIARLRSDLADATRRGDDATQKKVATELHRMTGDRREASAAERVARERLATALGARLPTDPAADLGRLGARWPIVMFPVRIETRFDRRASQLLVRVYPDEVLADGHEPELTDRERADGTAYWTDVADPAIGTLKAWRRLLQRYSAPRGAWIARATAIGAADPGTRSETWSKPVTAPILPERWAVVAYRGGAEIKRAFGSVIVEPIALTLSPDTSLEDVPDISGDGLKLDEQVAWTLDFDRAVAIGMAIRVPLRDEDLRLGFDRLIVLGAKTLAKPEDMAQRLALLFDAHHYTRGLAFVPQGTPTNNGTEGPSAWPVADPDGAKSGRVEVDTPLDVAGGDGGLLARSLGIPAATFEHVEGADRKEQASARAMNRALFPATLGYFLDQMMDPVVEDAGVTAARAHFVEHVRGRGPLPLIRVGNVPYGILPVTSLARFETNAKAETIDAQLVKLLQTLRPTWMAQLNAVPHVGRTGDAGADLLDVLSTDASTREVRVRRVLGESMQWNLLTLFGIDWTSWGDIQRAMADAVLTRLGHPEWDPRIAHANFSELAPRYAGPLVTPNVSETESLTPNYITWLRTASLAALRGETISPRPDALLYRLLRHCALSEVGRSAVRILVSQALIDAREAREPELHRIVPGTEVRATVFEHLARPVDAVAPGVPLFDYLAFNGAGASDFWAALQTLEGLPSAELDRLAGETLDTCAHRLDAWITSLASKRLGQMRERTVAGCHVGAFAFLEDVRPSTEPTVTLADGRTAVVSEGGYVHAPTMTHAAAAAVLRNAHLSHVGSSTAGDAFAIDITSDRSRIARRLMEAVRNGQPLGAVLGYDLERAFHERGVETLIEPLRRLYPLPTAPEDAAAGTPTEVVSPRNVVDGLRARTAFREGAIPFGTAGLPASGSARVVLQEELAKLDATTDAVADVLLAESVLQVVRGSTMAASASLDALSNGGRLPDPEILHAPSAGVTLTHRVALVLDDVPVALPAGWSAATPRSLAEPRVDAWLGRLLADPTNVTARVSWLDSSGNPADAVVSLVDLEVRPIDVLAFATATNDEQAASELDRRIAFAASGGEGSAVRIDYVEDPTRDPMTGRTFPEVLAIARAFATVLGRARQLKPVDLLAPEGAVDVAAAYDDAELMARAETAIASLQPVSDAVQAAVVAVEGATAPATAEIALLRAALRDAAAYGIPAAFPAVGIEEGGVAPPLLAQARSVRDEAEARIARAVRTRPPVTTAADLRVAAAKEMLGAIFGTGLPVVAGVRPTQPGELSAAIAYAPTLVPGPHAIEQWFEQVGRIRAALVDVRKARLFANACGVALSDFVVVQLPHRAGAQWCGLPLRDEDDRLGGQVSIAVCAVTVPAATDRWFGLLVDEWVETIPNRIEQTGIAFHHHDPGAEAAQTILVAVPPTTNAETWDFDTLLAILGETLDLAKIRAVDGELLGELGQMLPAIYLSANSADDAISTRFVGQLMAETRIVAGGT